MGRRPRADLGVYTSMYRPVLTGHSPPVKPSRSSGLIQYLTSRRSAVFALALPPPGAAIHYTTEPYTVAHSDPPSSSEAPGMTKEPT